MKPQNSSKKIILSKMKSKISQLNQNSIRQPKRKSFFIYFSSHSQMYEITHRPTQFFFSHHSCKRRKKIFPQKKTHTHAHRAKKNFTQFILGMIFNAISEWWDILTDSYLDLSHTVMSSNFGWIWYLKLEKM